MTINFVTVIMTINFGILAQWTVIMSINYLTVIMTPICCGISCIINCLIVAVKIFVCVVGCSSLKGKCLTERCILFNSHEKFSEPLLYLIFSTVFKPFMVIGCCCFLKYSIVAVFLLINRLKWKEAQSTCAESRRELTSGQNQGGS